MEKLQVRFGNLIRRRRAEKGLGQEKLADKAGIHRTHVSLLERGKRMPTLEVVRKLAAGLDTTMASLMEELERPADGGSASTEQAEAGSQAEKTPRPAKAIEAKKGT